MDSKFETLVKELNSHKCEGCDGEGSIKDEDEDASEKVKCYACRGTGFDRGRELTLEAAQ